MNKAYKSAVNLIKNFSWNSIFFYYLKVLFSIVLLPGILFVVAINMNHRSSLSAEIKLARTQSIAKASNVLNSLFTIVDEFSAMLMSRDEVQVVLQSDQYGGSYITNKVIKLNELISNMNLAFGYIHSVCVYSPRHEYIFSNIKSQYVDQSYTQEWYKHYKQTGQTNFVTSSISDVPGHKVDIINFCYKIWVNPSEYGLLVVNINVDTLKNNLYQSTLNPAEKLTLMLDNQVIYSDGYTLPDDAEFTSFLNSLTLNNYSMYKSAVSGTKLDNRQFSLLLFYPPEEYQEKLAASSWQIPFYIIFTAILSISLAAFGSFQLYRSVARVVAQVETPLGFTEKEQKKTYNEFVYLCQNILTTLENRKYLESELVDKIQKLKRTQAIALQTQINPHFLFNTLNLINGYILELSPGGSQASRMIPLLSDIIYAALNTKEYIISVGQELEHAKKYVEIERIKHANSFDVIWDAAPECMELKTVKFILQPIIENAIFHGLKPYLAERKQACVIIIRTRLTEGNLIFKIIDNGVGITEQKIQEINGLLDNDEIRENKHIGMSNVNQRIKLIYGKQYGLTISCNGQTSITITIPNRY